MQRHHYLGSGWWLSHWPFKPSSMNFPAHSKYAFWFSMATVVAVTIRSTIQEVVVAAEVTAEPGAILLL